MAEWLALPTSDFGSRGPRFESYLEAEFSSGLYDASLHRESFIVALPSSRYDLNNVERSVKHQTLSEPHHEKMCLRGN